MTQSFCIITGEPITDANNSRAHVIPSALGGRLKPWDILTKEANTLLGDKIDLPLTQAFQALMTLVGGSRDRGDNQPLRMTDASGRAVILEFGEPLKIAQPEYKDKEIGDDGLVVKINARTLKELRTLLGRVKAKRPDFDIDEAIKHAVTARVWPDGMLHGRLQIGPGVVFPAVFVAASIFAVHHGLAPHPGLRSFVETFDPEHPALPPDTFFFMPDAAWLSAPAELTHIVTLRGDASSRKMLVCIRLFGVITVGVILPYAQMQDRVESYAVDILTGEEVTAAIDEALLRSLPWQATHHHGDAASRAAVTSAIDKLLTISKDRMFDAEVKALFERALGTDETKPVTTADIGRVVTELAAFVLHEWERQTTTMAHRADDSARLERLCAQLESHLRPSERAAFRATAAAAQARLQTALAQASTV